MIGKRLFHISARFEVLCKKFAYSTPAITKIIKKFYFGHLNKHDSFLDAHKEDISVLFNYINSLGIKKGDILIVHSSTDALNKFDYTPNMIIDYLLELVGPEGTLVFPAYPIINRDQDYKYDKDGNPPLYDPKRTVSWTGILPNIFCRYKGTVRSCFPVNSLAANGKYAEEMMKNNLLGDLPHGKNSSWEFCINKEAKILFLGVEMERSDTVLHAAEDLLDEKWPIKDWYDVQEYRIKIDNEIINKKVRICSHKWTVYDAAFHNTHVFEKQGLIKKNSVDGVPVGFIPNSKKLVEYMIESALNGKIRCVVPRKCWKK